MPNKTNVPTGTGTHVAPGSSGIAGAFILVPAFAGVLELLNNVDSMLPHIELFGEGLSNG